MKSFGRLLVHMLTGAFVLILNSSFSPRFRGGPGVAHIFVVLCDNKSQGIVPVPAKIGNGQDIKNNLYWGCGYGVKMFFKNHAPEWKLVKQELNPKTHILERVVFKHKTAYAYLVADAYDGQYIKETTNDFLNAAAGRDIQSIAIDTTFSIDAGGASHLVAYVGHDGLMDFKLDNYPQKANEALRSAVILACASKPYFKEAIRQSGAKPLLWSTGLMSPEAYTLEATIRGWLDRKSDLEIRDMAANAYAKYQKSCSVKAAQRLLVTGY